MAVRERTITEARDDELDAVCALLTRANEEFRARLDPAAFTSYLQMVLDLESRRAASTLIVASVDERLVGTVTFYPVASDEGWGAEPGSAGLRAMAVDPEARGLGIGRALVEACVARARARGSTALTLHTAAWLTDAIALYERCGFARDPAGDLRASDIMDVPLWADYPALAYRRSLLD